MSVLMCSDPIKMGHLTRQFLAKGMCAKDDFLLTFLSPAPPEQSRRQLVHSTNPHKVPQDSVLARSDQITTTFLPIHIR